MTNHPRHTMRTLANAIAKHEGKRHQASIGDVREILAILSDLIYEDWAGDQYRMTFACLLKNGARRNRLGLHKLVKHAMRGIKPSRPKLRGRK